MAQPEFIMPECLQNNSAEEIHARMMANLPEDIDDMPGGFPYDFTMPTALEKDELINFHLVRVLMIAFPEYAWDDWLDLHGKQVHLVRHEAQYATGYITVTGVENTEIRKGAIFCTAATEESASIDFATTEDAVIGAEGSVTIPIQAVKAGNNSNVPAHTIVLMSKPNKKITGVDNEVEITGGTERESDNDFFDRIEEERANNLTYLGNDADYIRWAKEAGAGDCIVISAQELHPGEVKLALTDRNGKPASDELVKAVYDFIVSEDDRTKRLLPTACAKLICLPATTRLVNYTLTGLLYDETTSIEQIKEDFAEAVKSVYTDAKDESLLRYNDVRPLIRGIAGVEDFETFLIEGGMENIALDRMEYPETGNLDFS